MGITVRYRGQRKLSMNEDDCDIETKHDHIKKSLRKNI